MSSHEDLFESSVLEVIAPPPSLEFPTDYAGEQAAEWLSRMRTPSADRKAAFFDENLDFLLTIRFPSPPDHSPPPAPSPPSQLLSFLAHLQISYETAYISPTASSPDLTGHSRLSMPPPRNSSMQRNRPGSLLAAGANPSMFPPHTPHPIPSAAESDLKYVQSQGTPLVSAIWGESDSRDKEDFALLWDAVENGWLAVYKMSVLVLFMVTKTPDPLLSITVSTTLRNKPLAMTAPRKTLATMIDSVGGLKSTADVTSPVKSNGITEGNDPSESDEDDILSGLQEVNLLEGLAKGPTFTDEKRLSLPTTRLGANTRMHEFALGPPPSATTVETPVAYSTGVTSPPPGGNLPRAATLRKSFRKTLKTNMGFRVRMRTVFVPYFLLPQNPPAGKVHKPRKVDDPGASDSDSDLEDDILEEREQREAGNEEHTVVLSIEVENLFSGSSAPGVASYHFEVDRVDVSISGTGARASFIDWSGDPSGVFPLQVGPREQVNLLYAVSFLRGPEVDEFSLARPVGGNKKGQADELQRAVSIHLMVRPYEANDGQPSYPTRLFPSRWNCVLDLASSTVTQQQKMDTAEFDDGDQEYFVLPTPASPFPTAPLAPPTRTLTPLTTRSVIPLTAVAGSKRHTIAVFDTPTNDYARMPKSPMNYQSSTSMLNPNNQPPPPSSSPTPTGLASGQTLNIPNRASFIPPSVAFQASFPRSPTTYDAPTSPPLPLPPMHPFAGYTHSQSDSASTINEILELPTPRTPAYPAYPTSPAPVPPTPFWQTPIAQQSGPGTVGPSVEIRRERGGGVPQTPGPTVGGFGAFTNFNPMAALQQQQQQPAQDPGLGSSTAQDVGGEPIVVSVGLLPAPHRPKLGGNGSASGAHHHTGEMYPLEQFTLDIFVFNQSSWTRRFEVSYPDERRRRRKEKREKGEVRPPGIIPLDNRVRVGPLLPSTCQSVRMEFLALAPGVHSIEVLTLTDVQSGVTMHLRNVIDIIVREPEAPPAEDACVLP
ncbi:TRAPP trafficking subunit Trs65-domain-containing protein [Daedaleopsis nitida]|nr:TRAPP trafficking subunit Trs65-domain-containing protein [Daedaleopsis nitida]